MILADPINCTIPSMDALKTKGQEITCTTSLIDSAKGVELMWIAIAAIGALGSLIVTIFMARYAWKAWQTSRQHLDATLHIALSEKRHHSLPLFLAAVKELYESFDKGLTAKQIREKEESANVAGELWALTYPTIFNSGCIRSAVSTVAHPVWLKASFVARGISPDAGELVYLGLQELKAMTQYDRLRDSVQRLYGGQMTEEEFVSEYSASNPWEN